MEMRSFVTVRVLTFKFQYNKARFLGGKLLVVGILRRVRKVARERNINALILRPVSKLADLLPPNFAARYLRFDILFFPFASQHTSLFMSDVLKPVQGAIAYMAGRIGQVSCETGHRSPIFQILPQCNQYAAAGQFTRSTVKDR